MKFYALCVILLCSSAAFALLEARVRDYLYEYQRDCMIESGADTSLVAAADRARIIPNDGLLDTFAICMLKKYNILHKDGSVNQDHDSYTIFSDNPDVYRISERCKAKIGKDAGETARKIMNCFAEDGDSLLPYSTHPPPTPC